MSYQSIDTLQRTLADTVFSYATDRKKAAGRALGTLVEIITFYILKAWNLSNHIVIERRIPEFANPDIVHNVEFSLHRVQSRDVIFIDPISLPLTIAKLRKSYMPILSQRDFKSGNILSKDLLKRNCAVLADSETGITVANIDLLSKEKCKVTTCELETHPFAIFECKRVGVEEGMKKGPQTIEKAKQGAYVARSVSSLQKVRLRNGQLHGFIENTDGTFQTGPYMDMLETVVSSPLVNDYPGFTLTVGIVSNHGNWFTSDDHNKELSVLAQSYDWLLFLTDNGLSDFIHDALLSPLPGLEIVRNTFLNSYSGERGTNRFTKVRMDANADKALQGYFEDKERFKNWFNVIAPHGVTICSLKKDLKTLSGKHNRKVLK